MTNEKYRELLNNIDNIVGEMAALKKTLILEFKPAPDIASKRAFEDLSAISEESRNLWDKVSAVEEIRKQREK